jgi:hypothetical protein
VWTIGDGSPEAIAMEAEIMENIATTKTEITHQTEVIDGIKDDLSMATAQETEAYNAYKNFAQHNDDVNASNIPLDADGHTQLQRKEMWDNAKTQTAMITGTT